MQINEQASSTERAEQEKHHNSNHNLQNKFYKNKKQAAK